MNYSPKLKKAMTEIQSVLEAHDVAGVVVLHTPGFSEYLMKIDPSYSVAKINSEGIHVKTTGLNVSQSKKQQLIADTANMLNLLGTTTGTMAIRLMDISKVVDKATKATHTGGGHTSSQQLEN